MIAEAALVPLEHRPRLDKMQSLAPSGPESSEPRPEHTVAGLEAEPARSASFIDAQLMTQRNNLALECESVAECRAEKVDQGKQ